MILNRLVFSRNILTDWIVENFHHISKCISSFAEAGEKKEEREESESIFHLKLLNFELQSVRNFFRSFQRVNQTWIRISIPIYSFIFAKKSEFSICFYGAFLFLIARCLFLRQDLVHLQPFASYVFLVFLSFFCFYIHSIKSHLNVACEIAFFVYALIFS